MSTALTTRSHLGALVTSAATLGRVLEHAHSVEWDPPRHPERVARDADRSRRVVGTYNDPTAALALDGARLRVRATTAAADRAIEAAAWGVEAARRDVTAALAHFHGEDL